GYRADRDRHRTGRDATEVPRHESSKNSRPASEYAWTGIRPAIHADNGRRSRPGGKALSPRDQFKPRSSVEAVCTKSPPNHRGTPETGPRFVGSPLENSGSIALAKIVSCAQKADRRVRTKL